MGMGGEVKATSLSDMFGRFGVTIWPLRRGWISQAILASHTPGLSSGQATGGGKEAKSGPRMPFNLTNLPPDPLTPWI